MNTPFTYNKKEYSLESVILHIVRREINTYGKTLRSIIYSCCPAAVITASGDYTLNPSYSKNKTLIQEIQNIQDQYYFNRCGNTQKFSILSKLKNAKGKKYSIYDYFNLDAMYGYYELLKNIVEEYNAFKPVLKYPYSETDERKLWELYKTTRNKQLERIKEKFPKEILHHDFSKSPIVANKESQRKIEAMYEWLGLDEYAPHLVPTIVECYKEDINQTREHLMRKLDKVMMVNDLIQNQNKQNHEYTFYDPHTKECLGSGEPYYETINGKKILAGYITSDGDFVPKANIHEYTHQRESLFD